MQGLAGSLPHDNTPSVLRERNWCHSVMMMCGISNLTTRSLTNLSVVAPSAFLTGLAPIHLLNLSIATRRNSQPPRDDLFSFLTMSRFQTAKGQVIRMVLSSSAGTWGCFA